MFSQRFINENRQFVCFTFLFYFFLILLFVICIVNWIYDNLCSKMWESKHISAYFLLLWEIEIVTIHLSNALNYSKCFTMSKIGKSFRWAKIGISNIIYYFNFRCGYEYRSLVNLIASHKNRALHIFSFFLHRFWFLLECCIPCLNCVQNNALNTMLKQQHTKTKTVRMLKHGMYVAEILSRKVRVRMELRMRETQLRAKCTFT